MFRISMCIFALLLAVALGCNRPAETTTSTAMKPTNGTVPVSKSTPPGDDIR